MLKINLHHVQLVQAGIIDPMLLYAELENQKKINEELQQRMCQIERDSLSVEKTQELLDYAATGDIDQIRNVDYDNT